MTNYIKHLANEEKSSVKTSAHQANSLNKWKLKELVACL